MPSPSPERYTFGSLMLDLAERALSRHGTPIPLTPKAFDTLRVLVQKAGHLVTKDELLQQVWGETFVEEGTLAQNISTLRKALGPGPDGGECIETVTKLGYRFVAPVRRVADGDAPPESAPGASPALIARSREARRSSWRVRLAWLAVAAALFAGAYVGWPRRASRTEATSQRSVLAVLPFQNLTGDAGQDYFCDGLTEEMISRLGRVDHRRLGVIARTSSMVYRKTTKSAWQIGQELRADYLVEGSVRREGNHVRITAQIIRTSDQTHLWAQDFDRDLAGVFALQSEVASAVAAQIVPRLAPPVALARRMPQPDAYEAYLRARYHQARGTVQDAEQAIAAYEEAIGKDPQFAAAHAGLARVYIFGTRRRPRLAIEKARVAADRAVALDPSSPEAQLARALGILYGDRDLPLAERAFEQALALDPGSAEAHFYQSHALAAAGRFEEALAAARRAEKLDPFSLLISHYIGRIYYFARRYPEAEHQLQRTVALDPNYAWAHMFLALTYERAGRLDEAVRARQKYWSVMGVKPQEITRLGDAYRQGGYPAVLNLWARWIEGFAVQNGFVTSTELAILYGKLNRKDLAFARLERAVADHTRDLVYIKVEPDLDPLRSDRRFQDLLRRMNFPI